MKADLSLTKAEAQMLLRAISGPSCTSQTLSRLYYRLKHLIDTWEEVG